MEEILSALITIKKDLDDQRLEIQQIGKNVAQKVMQSINTKLEEKFLAIEKQHEYLIERVEYQEKRIQALERQERKNNLVFFGIEETEKSYESLERNTVSWLEQYLSVKISNSDLKEVKRIGKKEEKLRPIVVSFTTLGTKINILKRKKVLKDTNYYIKEDYPKHVLQKRKELQEQLQIEREKGNIAVIKYDKLIISKSNTKRKLPTSPEGVTAAINTKNTKNTQRNKKNKVQEVDASVKKPNSLTDGVKKQGILGYVTKNSTNRIHNKPSQLSSASPSTD